jgi:hypothetical protein
MLWSRSSRRLAATQCGQTANCAEQKEAGSRHGHRCHIDADYHVVEVIIVPAATITEQRMVLHAETLCS